MKKQKRISIFCHINDRYSVGLSDIRENMGHDDSVPFQANIFVWCKDHVPEGDTSSYKLIGSIWNDGWGGPSVIEVNPAIKDAIQYEKEISQEVEKHYMYLECGKTIMGKYSLETLLSIMAEEYLSTSSRKYPNITLEYRFDDDEAVIKSKGTLQLTIAAK